MINVDWKHVLNLMNSNASSWQSNSMNMLKLRANESHPTYKKVVKLIEFLENNDLELDWENGNIKVRDYKLCVDFDLVHEDTGEPQTNMPPLFNYKLVRDKIPCKYCTCKYCKE